MRNLVHPQLGGHALWPTDFQGFKIRCALFRPEWLATALEQQIAGGGTTPSDSRSETPPANGARNDLTSVGCFPSDAATVSDFLLD